MAWLSRNELAAGISQERRLRWPITRVMDLRKSGLRSQGMKSSTLRRAAGGMQQAGEHLEGGGLAGAIRAEETHDFAGLDRKS